MNRRRGWLVVIFGFAFGDGLVLQTRGPLLASFRSAFGVSEGLLGLVAPAGTVGFVGAVIVTGFVAGRLDFGRTLLVGIGATALALALLGGMPLYWLFLLVLVGQGTATGVVRALDRTVLSHLYPTQRGRMFTLYSLVWSLGAVSGPLFVTAALSATGWRVAYALLAVLFLPLVALLFRLELPTDANDERELSRAALTRLLRRPEIRGMAVAMVFVGFIEGAVFTWVPYYAAEFVGRELANVLLSVYLLAYVPGRLLYTWLSERIGYLRVALVLSVGAVPAFAAAFSGVEGWLLFGTVFVAGFFSSGFFPLLSAFGVDSAPEYSGPVNAIATAGTYAGIAVGPAGIGVLAEYAGIRTGMAAVPVFAGGLLATLLYTRRAV
ncbi:MFS transporter [Haloterrigena sp. SYSU A121-1]|uniref:MFS transporter n=1 Tax=Haloterrigena gelatinilytica TaxID=2741724 RepID=A0A8J8KGI3_9EURY|nr:MFS transporter [Haloterrigena gelatinilytica]NUB93448.1 MFS transporter [Haloterrigena gelatinilytica]